MSMEITEEMMNMENELFKERPIHRARHIREDGSVSPLCAKTPRALDLRSSTWTYRDDAVTCPRCLRLLAGDNDELQSGDG